MSDFTLTEPEALTGHTEVISSTSIEHIVTGRNTALKRIGALIRQLDAFSQLTSGVGDGTSNDWAMRTGHRYGSKLISGTTAWKRMLFRLSAKPTFSTHSSNCIIVKVAYLNVG